MQRYVLVALLILVTYLLYTHSGLTDRSVVHTGEVAQAAVEVDEEDYEDGDLQENVVSLKGLKPANATLGVRPHTSILSQLSL